MGIETEQRLRQLEQRLAALESGMKALQGAGSRSPVADEPATPKPHLKTSKSKAPGNAAKRRS